MLCHNEKIGALPENNVLPEEKKITLLGWQGIVVSFVIRKTLASCLRPVPFLAEKNVGAALVT